MTLDYLDTAVEAESDEDSVFVPIADLFTLLSLTVIYVVLTFGQTVPSLRSEPVIAARLQGTGEGKPIDPTAVYLSLSHKEAAVVFEITRNGIVMDKSVPMEGNLTKVPKDWILGTLSAGAPPRTIYVYLAPNEDDFVVKALLTDTERFMRSRFPNVRVAY
jgi:hypothetical protein